MKFQIAETRHFNISLIKTNILFMSSYCQNKMIGSTTIDTFNQVIHTPSPEGSSHPTNI